MSLFTLGPPPTQYPQDQNGDARHQDDEIAQGQGLGYGFQDAVSGAESDERLAQDLCHPQGSFPIADVCTISLQDEAAPRQIGQQNRQLADDTAR